MKHKKYKTLANLKFKKNQILITKHAKDKYRERINKYATDKQIENFFFFAVNKGRIRSIRDSIYESGKNNIEIRYIFNTYCILGIYDNHTLTIITCTGDRVQRGWHRQQVLGLPYKYYK